MELANWGSVDPETDYEDGDEFLVRPTFRTNYGKRVVGPWVLGIHKSRAKYRFILPKIEKGIHRAKL